MLGLRLDEPLPLGGLDGARPPRPRRMEALGLRPRGRRRGDETLELTSRGRFLGGAVTAEILA